jgi:hypothetical protein
MLLLGDGKIVKCQEFFSECDVHIHYMSPLVPKTGVFPDRLKYAIVRPLYKNGGRSSISNYRPVIITNHDRIPPYHNTIHTSPSNHYNIQTTSGLNLTTHISRFGHQKVVLTNVLLRMGIIMLETC